MKKLLHIFFFLFFLSFSNLNAEINIVYLDVQYIIDNSKLGVYYTSKLKIEQNKLQNTLTNNENKIKKMEKEINEQQNILKKDELDKKLIELRKLVSNYQNIRKKNNNFILDQKKKYSGKILQVLNPLLTNYVDINNITFVIEKKNILVGIKTLDITDKILTILDNETLEKKLIDAN